MHVQHDFSEREFLSIQAQDFIEDSDGVMFTSFP